MNLHHLRSSRGPFTVYLLAANLEAIYSEFMFTWHKLAALSQVFEISVLFHCIEYNFTLMHMQCWIIILFQDYYKILEVDYDATDEKIRLNYRKLALVSIFLFSPPGAFCMGFYTYRFVIICNHLVHWIKDIGWHFLDITVYL